MKADKPYNYKHAHDDYYATKSYAHTQKLINTLIRFSIIDKNWVATVGMDSHLQKRMDKELDELYAETVESSSLFNSFMAFLTKLKKKIQRISK